MSGGDSKEIDEWIGKINEPGSQIPMRLLHKALSTIVEHLKSRHPGSATADLARLELALVDRKVDPKVDPKVDHSCKLLLQKDARHIRWRSALKTGDALYCNGKTWILGDQIGKKNSDEDHNLIYALKDDPDHVVQIGMNEALLGMKQKLSCDFGFGVRMAEFKELDPLGRFAIVEKLSAPQFDWTSCKGKVSKADQDSALALKGLLKWLLEKQATPHNFSPKYLMFDPQGQLKCVKLSLKGEFDFNALEDFALSCAAGNLTIFQYLMGKSELNGHEFAKFYRKIIEDVLKGENTAIEVLGDGIVDSRVIDRGKALGQQVLQLQAECCGLILEKRRRSSPKDLAQQVGKQIFRHYERTLAAGILWPSLKDDVVQALL